jgi:glutaredoxin
MQGFHFVFASPSEGLRVLRGRQIDLVVLDALVSCEERSAIKRGAERMDVPVLAVSRHEGGMEDRLSAPMPRSPSELAALLGAHTTGNFLKLERRR